MDGGSCLAIPISIVIIVEPSQLSNAAKPREHPKKPHSNAWRLGHRLELRPQEGWHIIVRGSTLGQQEDQSSAGMNNYGRFYNLVQV